MYAAKVQGGTVVQVVVGTPEWATERLGGEWVGLDAKVGVGWQVVDGTITPPEPEGDYYWDENGQKWAEEDEI